MRNTKIANQAAVLAASGTNPTDFKRRVLRIVEKTDSPQLRLTRGGILAFITVTISLAVAPLLIRVMADDGKIGTVEGAEEVHPVYNDELKRFVFQLEHLDARDAARNLSAPVRRRGQKIMGAYADVRKNRVIVIGPATAERAIRESLAELELEIVVDDDSIDQPPNPSIQRKQHGLRWEFRRVHLDLTGLPPTAEQINDFANADAAKRARIIKRLLKQATAEKRGEDKQQTKEQQTAEAMTRYTLQILDLIDASDAEDRTESRPAKQDQEKNIPKPKAPPVSDADPKQSRPIDDIDATNNSGTSAIAPMDQIKDARVLIERAKVENDQSKRDRFLEKARDLFNEAGKTYQSKVKELSTKLKTTDNLERGELTRLRTEYLQSLLYHAAIQEETAETHPAASQARDDALQRAADEYHEVYKLYRSRLAGLYARMYHGRCLQKRGKKEEAVRIFEELLKLPDNPAAFRTLKTKVNELLEESKQDEKVQDGAALQGEKHFRNQLIASEWEVDVDATAKLGDIDRKTVNELRQLELRLQFKENGNVMITSVDPKQPQEPGRFDNLKFDKLLGELSFEVKHQDQRHQVTLKNSGRTLVVQNPDPASDPDIPIAFKPIGSTNARD